MYNRFYIFVSLIILGIFFNFHIVKAEQIDNFTTDIVINSDSSLQVTETIEYDFGGLQKHGIYRDITSKYKRQAGNYKIRISDVEVTNELGEKYNFKVSVEGVYTRIKIGDANKYITGKKIYKIRYTVR